MSAVDDLARRLRGLRVTTTTRTTVTGSGPAPTTASTGMPNPMKRVGAMIRGGQDGAPVELRPGLEGQVLTMIDGRPQWRYPIVAGEPLTTNSGEALTTADGEQLYTAGA